MSKSFLQKKSFWITLLAILISLLVGNFISPTYVLERNTIDVQKVSEDSFAYIYRGELKPIDVVQAQDSQLISWQSQYKTAPPAEKIELALNVPSMEEEFIQLEESDSQIRFQRIHLQKHFGIWSLYPAFVAILLCWFVKEPMTALFGGIIAGAFILGKYNITEDVLLESMMSKSTAGVLLLYLWLLGGLLGVWAKTGAAQAFAEFMATHFVRGPRSAKLVAWCLGILFFQGGTVSTVLVGTTVKPLADKHHVSHEELSYVVDSTASPIASQLAFNAWPGYIQSFIFVGGVSFLATESDRISFFFSSVPFCFYAILAVCFTFLLSIEKSPFMGKRLKEAMERSRSTGQLDRPGAEPLSAKELSEDIRPTSYRSHVSDFLVPLAVLIIMAIGTFLVYGSPEVRWSFAAALITSIIMAMAKGMKLKDVIDGMTHGMKGVVLGSVILVLAITIGGISQETGGGAYLIELLGSSLPYWSLPVVLQIITIITAFSTGTSWGTYAVAFPLAMPLAWAVAQSQGLEHPEFFMTICFAAVMDGSVFGDQCSPISDTTILSSMCTGCDLMDHVKTQIPQASLAAFLASVLWTGSVVIFA
ncbi:MAG: sodium:proton antiporter [Pseudobacteriovorax sp.]|nr:sodium:proton antiporter [Pseudobacteriovorax sp.]